VARFKTGDSEGAIADLTRAIELDPRNAEAWLNRGLAREKRNEIGGAIADFEQYVALSPSARDAEAVRKLIRDLQGRSR
jgi:regulator of sirC expression with transglutaminase-like and TPR domain